MYDTLVLAGNATNAIVTMGAIQYVYEQEGLMRGVRTIIGTSSGAILGLLLSIGYSPMEILMYLCWGKVYKRVGPSNIVFGRALLAFEPIRYTIEELIVNKLGSIPTMGEIKQKFSIHLVCVTYNLTTDTKVYISPDTHPDLSSLVAVQMSSAFPFVFDLVQYDDEHYVDGGLVDNFAIEYGEKIGGKCLGIHTTAPPTRFIPDMLPWDMFHKLFTVFTDAITRDKINRIGNSDIVELSHETQFFNFTVSNTDLMNMFDKGYDSCRDQINHLAQ